MSVPAMWVLLMTLVSAARESSGLSTQFWTAEPIFCHTLTREIFKQEEVTALSVEYCTATEQSCDFDQRCPISQLIKNTF